MEITLKDDMALKVKVIDHGINIIKGVARICGDDKDQLYVLIEAYNQLTHEHARNEQDQMRRCRAAVGCLIGALVPHEYFDSFMEDIGLLEDEIYDEKLLQEVQDE